MSGVHQFRRICLSKRVIFVFFVLLPVLMFIFVFLHQKREVRPKLKIMVYSSFLSPYGPARDIQERFEKICQCQVQWMKVEDSALITQRLKLRSDGMKVDVVLGLDQITAFSSKKEIQWKPVSFPMDNIILKIKQPLKQWSFLTSIKENKYDFAPISWSPFIFISRSSKDLPKNFLDLLSPQWKKNISLPHPRLSTVGLQFYFWLFSQTHLKERISFLNHFKNQIYNLSRSWSYAYGLFQKNFTDMVFSYQTSLVYHWMEDKHNYFPAYFREGHPYQIEFAAVPSTCVNCVLAEQWIHFLLKKEIQEILMRKNYMLPVIKGVVQNTLFENLEEVRLLSYKKLDQFLLNKKQHLHQWEEILY